MFANLDINIDLNSKTPVYIQISRKISSLIKAGVLPDGSILPPERKLASFLKVNRSTVLNAYRELKADGYAYSQMGSGTVVRNEIAVVDTISCKNELGCGQIAYSQLFSSSVSRAQDNTVNDLLRYSNRKDIVSFAAGIVSSDSDSSDEMKKMLSKAEVLADIEKLEPNAINHTPAEGSANLREQISQFSKLRGIECQAQETMIFSGSQQGLDFIARIFLDPGDFVIVEEPTYFCALQIFRMYGARIISIPMDNSGIRMDLLSYAIERYKPKLIYTMPTFQNPTGTVMSTEKRVQMVELARQNQTLVVEDDAYYELWYEGERPLPIKAYDKYGCVIYLSTFSKLLFSGIRVGWSISPVEIIRKFAVLKQYNDLHAASLSQYIVEKVLNSGLLSEYLINMRERNMKKRNLMAGLLKKYAPREFIYEIPRGGLYIWGRMPEGIDTNQLLTKAMDKKIAYLPGSECFHMQQHRNFIRLNFTYPDTQQMESGVKLLCEILCLALEELKSINEMGKYKDEGDLITWI